MSTFNMTKPNDWRDVIMFVQKVLKTGLISRTAAVVSCAYLDDPRTRDLYTVVSEYRDRLPKMSVEAQIAVLRKLVEAGDADSMLQLVFNEAVSVKDVNDMLEAIDPFDCENMIFECQGEATQGQEWEEKHLKALEFIEQLLSSGIVNWMAAWSALVRFDFIKCPDYAAIFCEFESQLPRQSHSVLIQVLKYAIQAESSEDLKPAGVMPLNDLNEMLAVFTTDPRVIHDYIQDFKWAAAVEKRLEPYVAQITDEPLEDDYGGDNVEDDHDDDEEAQEKLEEDGCSDDEDSQEARVAAAAAAAAAAATAVGFASDDGGSEESYIVVQEESDGANDVGQEEDKEYIVV